MAHTFLFFVCVCYRNANESKSAMLEFLEQVYNYINRIGVTNFYLDLMQLHFDDLPETALKFVENDEKMFRDFFSGKFIDTPLIPLNIFNKIETFLVRP